MRFGGRLSAAIEILEDMAARHRPASDTLKDWGLSHRFAGSGDRAAIGNIVHDALRHRRSAARALGNDTARAEAFGAVILDWGFTAEKLGNEFEGDKFAPEPLSAGELKALAAFDHASLPEAVRADVADWCAPLLEETFGADWVAEAEALAHRPPLDLRTNTLKATPEKVLNALKRQGAFPAGLATGAIRIPPVEGAGRHPNVQAEPAFQKGWFEIQDLGSQIAALLTGAAPGEQVLDLCAGAGGKTLALSAMMENRGQIFAHDAEKQRLAPIFERTKRAGCRNVQVISESEGLNNLEARADLVLVDAPCTGSGTWRRRPDAKWRLGEAQLETRLAEQANLLRAAARYVKPGGRLVYVTCSVFRSENDAQIERFASENPAFVPVDHQACWNEAITDGAGNCRIGLTGITLSPCTTGTDGFFVSLMRKDSNA
jgi:16S rRNA (cytosine967-C5)-methyltransferase